MLINIKKRNIKGSVTTAMEEKVNKEFAFLNRYLNDTFTLQLTVIKKKQGLKVELYLPLRDGYDDIKLFVYGEDFYQCLSDLKHRAKENYFNQKKCVDRKYKDCQMDLTYAFE